MSKIRQKPYFLNVHITTDIPDVDFRVRVYRGGQIRLALSDGEDTDGNKPFGFNLPIKDQRDWVVDKNGLKPAPPGIFDD